MRKFHYRAGKNAAAALFMGGLTIMCAMLWWRSGGFISLGGFLLFGAGAAKSATDAMSNEPALAFGGEGLRMRTMRGIQVVSWTQVQAISLEVFTYRYWGIIPIAKHENVVVKCDGGLFGARRLRLAATAIELPVGGAIGLVALLQAAHVAAVGEAGVAMAGAGERGWGVAPSRPAREEQASSFDPDVALARYMARKESEPVQSAVPAAIPGVPAAPARPAFGRRGL
jgi:hypothetical protein